MDFRGKIVFTPPENIELAEYSRNVVFGLDKATHARDPETWSWPDIFGLVLSCYFILVSSSFVIFVIFKLNSRKQRLNKFQKLLKIVKFKTIIWLLFRTVYKDGVNQSLPGFNQSLPGLNQSLPGVNQSLPGVNQSLPGFNQSLPGVNQSLRVKQSIPGVNQSILGINKSLPGVIHSLSGVNQSLGKVKQSLGKVNRALPGVNKFVSGEPKRGKQTNKEPRISFSGNPNMSGHKTDWAKFGQKSSLADTFLEKWKLSSWLPRQDSTESSSKWLLTEEHLLEEQEEDPDEQDVNLARTDNFFKKVVWLGSFFPIYRFE